MYDFTYHMKFKILGNKLNISLFLSIEDYFTPVYSRVIDKEILSNKNMFRKIYREIEEYLENSNLIINTDELKLLHNTLTDFHISLPQLLNVTLDQYDSFLDDYEHLLTPKQIIFLIFADELAVNDKRFANWEKENHLDVEYHLDMLVRRGYLTTDNYLKNIRKSNRDQLLNVVNKHRLDARGDNNDLIREISKQLTDEQLCESFKGTHYTLTEKGKKIVKKSTKIDDFHRSYYKYASNLKIEEFHLITIKKSEYDFLGVCKLIMVNSNNSVVKEMKYFDWKSLFEKKAELKKDFEEVNSKVDTSDEEFLDLVSRVSANFNHGDKQKSSEGNFNDLSEIKQNEIIDDYEVDDLSEEEIESELIEVPYDIEENYKISQSLNSYQKRKARFEKQGSINFENEFFKTKQRKTKKNLWLLLVLLVLVVCIGSLVYFEILEFEEIKELLSAAYEKIKDTVNNLFKKLKNLF